MLPLGGEGGDVVFLRNMPVGYQVINVLRNVMRMLPGIQVDVGCGLGIGFCFRIGI